MSHTTRLTGHLSLDSLSQKWAAEWQRLELALPPEKISIETSSDYCHTLEALWRASKFVLMHLEGWDQQEFNPQQCALTVADRWMFHRLDELLALPPCSERLRDALIVFIVEEFCLWYLPFSKLVLYEMEDYALPRATLNDGRTVLAHVLSVLLILLHPFAPHLTEEIWSHLPRSRGDQDTLRVVPHPVQTGCGTVRDVLAVTLAVEVIQALVELREQKNLGPLEPLGELIFKVQDTAQIARLEAMAPYMRERLRPESIRIIAPQELASGLDVASFDLSGGDGSRVDASVDVGSNSAEDGDRELSAETLDQRLPKTFISIQLQRLEVLVGFDDADANSREAAQLKREVSRIDHALVFVRRRLDNSAFLERAPERVVLKEKTRHEALCAERESYEARLVQLALVMARQDEE